MEQIVAHFIAYYVMINMIWFLVLSLGTIGMIAQIQDCSRDSLPRSIGTRFFHYIFGHKINDCR